MLWGLIFLVQDPWSRPNVGLSTLIPVENLCSITLQFVGHPPWGYGT